MPTAGGDGRSDLLSSIRNAGGLSALKKVEKSEPSPAVGGTSSPLEGSEGGDDLAAALRAALTRRKGAVGDSGKFISFALK
jgi:Wiskott-Aldrich syndrome protein